MVDPLSLAIGAGLTIVVVLAMLGLYLAGRQPDHIIDMREIASYYRQQSAAEALQEDIDNSEEDE
jgi:hypothetical protein